MESERGESEREIKAQEARVGETGTSVMCECKGVRGAKTEELGDTRKDGTRRAEAKGKHTRMRGWMQSVEEKKI